MHTSAERVEMLVAWLNEDGYAVRFREDVNIRVVGSNRQFLNTNSSTSTEIVVVTIDLYPERTRADLVVSSGDWRRIVTFVKDAVPPVVQIELMTESDKEEFHEYILLISFSEPVVWDSQATECPEMRRINRRQTEIGRAHV